MNFISFLSGIYMASFCASGIFFLKFYQRSGDRFFKFFTFACWLLAFERLALIFVADPFPSVPSPESESHSWTYFIRLAAFLLILFAIIDKNRQTKMLR